MSDIWFTSDLHLGHARILEFCGNTRRGSTVDEHDENIIEAWNSVVKKGDVVYILGDECLGDRDKGYKNIARLNGCKHLIRGNHSQLKTQEHKDVFQDIRDYKRISVSIDGRKQGIIMCHFPIISWDSMTHGTWMLFGHCHGNLHDFGGKMLDVGLDTRPNKDMKPWHLDEINEYMKSRDSKIWDHH